MIKVNIKKKNSKIYEIIINGHANYAESGKDIVCAAVSTLATTVVNNILVLDESIDYTEKSGMLSIRVLKDTEINQKLLNNMLNMLEDIRSQYPKNIDIRNEE